MKLITTFPLERYEIAAYCSTKQPELRDSPRFHYDDRAAHKRIEFQDLIAPSATKAAPKVVRQPSHGSRRARSDAVRP